MTVNHGKHHALLVRGWHGVNKVRIPPRGPRALLVRTKERCHLLDRRTCSKGESFLAMRPHDARVRTTAGATAQRRMQVRRDPGKGCHSDPTHRSNQK